MVDVRGVTWCRLEGARDLPALLGFHWVSLLSPLGCLLPFAHSQYGTAHAVVLDPLSPAVFILPDEVESHGFTFTSPALTFRLL